MFSFAQKQRVVKIGEYKIGGQPGENPTLIIGGVAQITEGTPEQVRRVYDPHSVIEGLPDKIKNMGIVDFFISCEEDIEKIINFALEHVPEKKLFSVGITSQDLKPTVLNYLGACGALNRVLYNSIYPTVNDKEIEALKEYTPAAAILMAFNLKDNTVDGRIEMLETGAGIAQRGLLRIAKEVGLENILVDTGVTVGMNSGSAVAAVPVIKEEYGLPTGCATHNIVENAGWLDLLGKGVKSAADVALSLAVPLVGGNWTMYGGLVRTTKAFGAVSLLDKALVASYTSSTFGVRPDASHAEVIFDGY